MSSIMSRIDPIVPGDELSRLAGESVRVFEEGVEDLGDGNVGVGMSTPEGERTLLLPAAIVPLIVRILAGLANRNPVTIIPEHAELTIREAADVLDVSRAYVIGLLDRGEFPARGEGMHRRVVFGDLKAYKVRSDEQGRRALAELTELAQGMGPR